MSTLDGKTVLTLQSIVFKFLLETCTQNMSFKNQREVFELLQNKTKKLKDDIWRENTYKGIHFRENPDITSFISLLEMTPEKRQKIDEFYELIGDEQLKEYQIYDYYQDALILKAAMLGDKQFFYILSNFEKIGYVNIYHKDFINVIEIIIGEKSIFDSLRPYEKTFLKLLKGTKVEDHNLREVTSLASVIFYSDPSYTLSYLRGFSENNKYKEVLRECKEYIYSGKRISR